MLAVQLEHRACQLRQGKDDALVGFAGQRAEKLLIFQSDAFAVAGFEHLQNAIDHRLAADGEILQSLDDLQDADGTGGIQKAQLMTLQKLRIRSGQFMPVIHGQADYDAAGGETA